MNVEGKFTVPPSASRGFQYSLAYARISASVVTMPSSSVCVCVCVCVCILPLLQSDRDLGLRAFRAHLNNTLSSPISTFLT